MAGVKTYRMSHMKKTILFFAFTLLSTSAFAALDNNADCDIELNKHDSIVKETNQKFAEYNTIKNEQFSSYDVQNFEHLITTRIKHIETLQKVNCESNSVREALIQADMIDLSKYVFSDFKLRRVVSLLRKYKKVELPNLKNLYYKYTKSETLSDTLNAIEADKKDDEIKSLNINLDLVNIKPMTTLSDLSVKALSGAIGGLAKTWGKVSDATVWREGHLKDNQEALQLLKSNLKPFDFVYESRDYTLSHYTIPGHFGHVAIWMGTKEELESMGLWEQDFMAPFREAILAGKNIVEVRKPGVQFVSLESFINLDEIAITRLNQLPNSAEDIFKNITQQFGKKYDYAFDAHSENKITCAELVSFTYGDIDWPMTAKMSVVNLRPDDMAVYGIKNPEKAKFVMYLKGNKDFKTFQNIGEEEFNNLFK